MLLKNDALNISIGASLKAHTDKLRVIELIMQENPHAEYISVRNQVLFEGYEYYSKRDRIQVIEHITTSHPNILNN